MFNMIALFVLSLLFPRTVRQEASTGYDDSGARRHNGDHSSLRPLRTEGAEEQFVELPVGQRQVRVIWGEHYSVGGDGAHVSVEYCSVPRKPLVRVSRFAGSP